jgi:hypothetical protein
MKSVGALARPACFLVSMALLASSVPGTGGEEGLNHAALKREVLDGLATDCDVRSLAAQISVYRVSPSRRGANETFNTFDDLESWQ